MPAGTLDRKIAVLLELFGLGGAVEQGIAGYSKGLRRSS